MKKALLLFFLLCTALQLAFAQGITVTGTVKDDQGNPLQYAFVRDQPFNLATFSDSLGNFKLMINPNSSLQITRKGYTGTTINTAGKTSFDIVLHLNAPKAASSGEEKVQGSMSQGSTTDANQNFQFVVGGTFAAPKKGDAHGSQYFFDDWAHGFVIDSKDSLVQNPNYLYNYDKIGGGLLFTQDTKTAMEATREQVKSFTLFSDKGETAVFEKAPGIDNAHYLQVLASGKKYKIYKLVKTQFFKADYQTNGISSSGNNYDEYVNTGQYYVLNMENNQVKELLLKKKSIKEVFAADADKVNKFMADNSSDIDDTYLSSLGNYLNN